MRISKTAQPDQYCKQQLQALFLVLALSIPTMSYADPNTITIGRGGDYPPYHWTQDGKAVGICPDIIRAAASALGINVVFKQFPWQRMLDFGKNGKVDAVMNLFKTPERESFLFFSQEPLAWEITSFYTRSDVKVPYEGNLHSLQSYNIGVVSGYSYGDLFDNADFLQKEPALNDDQLIQKVHGRRHKIAIGNIEITKVLANERNIKLNFLTPYVAKNALYIAFTRKKGRAYDKLSKDFSKAIHSIHMNEIDD